LTPSEFTGERVVPGKVEVDLWNEHFSRYALAASRFASGKRVLDLGCGTGYGSAELARVAAAVTGVDVAEEAVAYAREHFARENTTFVVASAAATGLPDASFDLVTAFEVIEHLADWKALLAEVRRLLAPGGVLLVSTPNRLYYAESRGESGANPYHEHEFEFEEFRDALREFFPAVTMLLQNRLESFCFYPAKAFPDPGVRVDASGTPATAHFFLAVCGDHVVPDSAFVYVPSAANLLREREHHIAKLRAELAMKERWLEQTRAERDELHRLHTNVQKELEEHNRWAHQLESELAASRERVLQLQQELAGEQAEGQRVAAAYDSKVAELERDVREKAAWAEETEQRLMTELQAKVQELAEAVRLLDQSEATVAERTQWALGLQDSVAKLEARMAMIRASRWVRLGRVVGVGPRA